MKKISSYQRLKLKLKDLEAQCGFLKKLNEIYEAALNDIEDYSTEAFATETANQALCRARSLEMEVVKK